MSRLLIAASGTGGHLFPALAVAEALPSSWEIIWLGVPNRLETEVLPKHFHLETIKAGGLQGRGLRKLFQFFQLLFATLKVRKLNRSAGIDVVFTTGGYIAAPAILGAIWCGIPVIIHESNAFPGKVTRLMGRFCNLIALGFPPAAKHLSGYRTVLTGTPVRSRFFCSNPLPSWVPLGAGPLIVVMGGSQGAVGLNLMVRKVLPSLLENGCRVVHLTGNNDPDVDKFRHQNYIAKSFCKEIPALLQHADLAISRAGSGAISELAVCGTPTILVPFPSSTDQHQECNASYAAELGAAVIVHEHDPDHSHLSETLSRLLKVRLSGKFFDLDPLIKMKLGMEELAVKEPEQALINILKRFS